MKRIGPIDLQLWHICQKIAYPGRRILGVSNQPPFDASGCAPNKRPASWLYHTLAADKELMAKVITVVP